MHMRRDDHEHGPKVVPVRLILEDPEGLAGVDKREWDIMAGVGESVLEAAMDAGINIEHACGGVCACSTCHVYVQQGGASCSKATDDEEDELDKAPALTPDSRLSCQCVPNGSADVLVVIPKWNRNQVKEGHH